MDTPFGGIHVNTDQTTARTLDCLCIRRSDVMDGDKHKSADVHLGFGEWELRVRAFPMRRPTRKEKVTAFYKKALGRYGD